MASIPIGQPAPYQSVRKAKSGSGQLGTTAGLIGGAALGAGLIAGTVATGGALAPVAISALGAAGAGAGLGGTIGNALDPARAGKQFVGQQVGSIPLLQSTTGRTIMNAIAALPDLPREINQAASPYLAQAYLHLNAPNQNYQNRGLA